MPTAAQIRAEVASQVGRLLDDAGLFVPDSPGGPVGVVTAGLRKGAAAVGVSLTDPMAFSDADAANLSSFATVRVQDEAIRHCLNLVLMNWYRVAQKHMDAREPQPDVGGWLAEQKSSVRARLAELNEMLAEPYREPADPMVVVTPCRAGWCPTPDSTRAVAPCYPADLGYGPYGYPYGLDCP